MDSEAAVWGIVSLGLGVLGYAIYTERQKAKTAALSPPPRPMVVSPPPVGLPDWLIQEYEKLWPWTPAGQAAKAAGA